jgi:glycosyltransferase involved in cell wall biosynthesis
MILGIDASNIRAGGTVTHLAELLRAADALAHGFTTVVVWASSSTLAQLADRPWLKKVAEPLLEQSADPFRDRRHLLRAYWQRFLLRRRVVAEKCDVLFVPGGLLTAHFHPTVTMSQNMLPFTDREARRYGFSLSRLRLVLLRLGQSRSFRKSAGIIFLTRHARARICEVAGIDHSKSVLAPHGIARDFFAAPRPQRSLAEYSAQQPFRILYVSTIDLYKHQWHVARAIASLRKEGHPVALELVGPANGAALQRLRATLSELDPRAEFITYSGAIAYEKQAALYARADLGVFASSCENLPIILLEGMAAGLPIACSRYEPMPEVLGDAGLYFDPESPEQIAGAIRELLVSPELRAQNAARAFARAEQYSWARCAEQIFSYLAGFARSPDDKLPAPAP